MQETLDAVKATRLTRVKRDILETTGVDIHIELEYVNAGMIKVLMDRPRANLGNFKKSLSPKHNPPQQDLN